jgi:hypothetical protein
MPDPDLDEQNQICIQPDDPAVTSAPSGGSTEAAEPSETLQGYSGAGGAPPEGRALVMQSAGVDQAMQQLSKQADEEIAVQRTLRQIDDDRRRGGEPLRPAPADDSDAPAPAAPLPSDDSGGVDPSWPRLEPSDPEADERAREAARREEEIREQITGEHEGPDELPEDQGHKAIEEMEQGAD